MCQNLQCSTQFGQIHTTNNNSVTHIANETMSLLNCNVYQNVNLMFTFFLTRYSYWTEDKNV